MMADTTPPTAKPDTDDSTPGTANTHKQPENAQESPPKPHSPSVQATPSTNPDNPAKDADANPGTTSEPVVEEETKRTDGNGIPTNSAAPRDEDRPSEPNPGEAPVPSPDVAPDGRHPIPDVNAFGEHTSMQIDTPTLPKMNLTDETNTNESGLPFVPLASTKAQETDLDLLPRIPGLFRLLDLVSDRNIEKIIIDHDSMGAAMNTLREGSYRTISRINFGALDGVSIQPVGLYGTKSALTRTLVTLGAVDEPLAELLRKPLNRNGQLSPYLRSGIYLLLSPSPSNAQASSSTVIHVIYWPEDQTWDDDAPPSIQKNRVTFMRYLTKLAQDIRPLVSEEHAAAFVWKHDIATDDRDTDNSDSSTESESDDDDRFVKFEVKKSGKEEEAVQPYPGFTFTHPSLVNHGLQNNRVSLVSGETSQAFVISRSYQAGWHEKPFNGPFHGTWLRTELTKERNVYLGDGINEEIVETLFGLGAMNLKASQMYLAYKDRKKELEPRFMERKDAALSKLRLEWPVLKKHVERIVRGRFSEVYNTLHAINPEAASESQNSLDYLTQASARVRQVRTALERFYEQKVPPNIDSEDYETLRDRFIDVEKTLQESVDITEEDAQLHIDSITSSDKLRPNKNLANSHGSGYSGRARRFATSIFNTTVSTAVSTVSTAVSTVSTAVSTVSTAVSTVSSVLGPSRQAPKRPRFSRSLFGHDDAGFLQALEPYNSRPVYNVAVLAIKDAATNWIERRIRETSDELAGTMQNLLEAFTTNEAFQVYCEEESAAFMQDLRQALAPDSSQPSGIRLENLQPCSSSSRTPKFMVKGSTYSLTPPYVEHSMIQIQARREETDILDGNPSYVPSLMARLAPVVRTVPEGWEVIYLHLLDQGRRILHVLESADSTRVYLNDTRDPHFRKCHLRFASRKDRSLFFAVDEQARILAIIYTEQQRAFIQEYSIDEHFEEIQPRSPLIEITQLFNDGPPSIQDVCFFTGSDGICLLEKSRKIRVFSRETKEFWPGSITLSSIPVMMQASPDGSALLLVERAQDKVGLQLLVYHQATFGQKPDGIMLPLPPEFNDAASQSFTVSSLGQRPHIYLIAHTPSTSRLTSVALRISRSESHYSFRRKQTRRLDAPGIKTKHNSLIDCFADVWERFPVVPAISRELAALQPPLSLTFVKDSEESCLDRAPRYFTAMTQDFTRQSHKPTGRRLNDIQVRVLSDANIQWRHSGMQPYQAGAWFVELICLIPVHIAVARENHFLPLKDGISGEALQQQLLGSEVADIIDIVTLGPYEAILGSYMARRPVRVVSSMGEQSVGKSFSLNHLVDTSFAGSAMRTTEGVWLSLCPTKDQVVVALDFEGVHSLERTAQEDMLLVLFNAAISNLIMFRNNFALSRNIANMFTSFQASASLFEPEHNPKLFKGLLTIIIKDVMDADKKEIVEEFGSKFDQIVNNEQDKNFITVLHDNQLAVMPWDVIRSKEFYTRFSKLSKYLFKQQSTHANAGEFLLTLKTLMAKITAQDWGAIDETLIRHRTSLLQASLERALISGQGDIGPFGELEELKNYDTQQALEGSDTDAIFYLGTDDAGRQEKLDSLLARLGPEPARTNLEDLKAHIQEIGMQRILRVKTWIDSNISRFMPTDNSDIKALIRKLDELSTTLLANLQLCRATCNSCQLRCLRPKAHVSGEHDCGTTHRCIEPCTFCASKEHGETKMCGIQAGHDGSHICEAKAHVCGKTCQFNDKRGCQETCIKPINHSDNEHTCAANLHQCGEPCKLQNVDLYDGQSFSCPNVCVLPFDKPHTSHSCGEERSCPVQCELCPRYCSIGDHFHGLESGATHLCEQDHACHEICQSPGVCRVEPKSESVETIYYGMHDTFSYPKFTQIAQRLRCEIRIPQGQRAHQGPHAHTIDPSVTHFCEASCPQCGYICHLPYGHTQREHDTFHGSMQKTVWAIEGSENATVETEGHRFGAQESGAPQLCFMYCKHLGRHAHIDFCRNPSGYCQEAETEHAGERILPEADIPKDWVSHRLFWARTGFKDPYPRTDQANFALCDHQCPGPEHTLSTGNWAGSRYCTLPIFHPPPIDRTTDGPHQHVSADGHHFNCPDPASLIPAFHVIFVLDRSWSMLEEDRQPLRDQPVARQIASRHDNRFGAVLSAFYQFLKERSSASNGSSRRDAYSVIVFNDSAEINMTHDTTSSVEQMLQNLLGVTPAGGTDFGEALVTARQVMEQSWSAERSPVVIFLSDGEARSERDAMTELCDRAVALGKPLSFWAISFGPYSEVLQEMAEIAKQTATRAARSSGGPPVACDFRTAINTVQLANEFSNIATSLRKTRAALINPTAPAYTRSSASSSALISL